MPRVPIKRSRYRIAWHLGCDDIGGVGGLFGVNDQPVIDGHVGGDDDGLAPDDGAVFRFDPRVISSLDP